MEEFKKKHTLEQRKQMSQKQSNQYFGCKPLIIEPAPFSKLSLLTKSRFICQGQYNIRTLKSILIKKIQKTDGGDKVDSLIFFAGGKQMSEESMIQKIYNEYKDEDGFLYLNFDCQQNLKSIQKINQENEGNSEGQKLSSSEYQIAQIQEQEETQIKVKCMGDNQAAEICSNDSCKEESIFLCFNESCECRAKHQECKKLQIQSAIKKVKRKFVPFQKSGFQQEIDKVFDKIIDDVSTIRDRLITSLKQKIKHCQVDYEELEFLNIVETGQKHLFFDPRKFKIFLDKQKSSKIIFQSLRTRLDNLKQINQQFIFLCNKALEPIDTMLNQNRLEETLKVKQLLAEKFLQAKQHIDMRESSIVSHDRHIMSLWLYFHKKNGQQNLTQKSKELLEQKPFVSVKLLFKASQQNFDIKSYFEKCGSAQNTFILCLTNKDKIIGGYSPLNHSWDSKENGENPWTADKSGKSFIFSLSDPDTFDLRNSQKAVYRDPQRRRIRFGQGDFEICDKSNQTQECFTVMNKAYNSQFCEIVYRQKVFEYFNGNPTSSFTTKEWEVWQLQF